MDYELAKELKDAGFPQGPASGDHHDGGNWIDDERRAYYHAVDSETECYIPTLSELIEACGWGVVLETHYPSGATAMKKTNNGKETDWIGGTTPEEAVARLWLALNPRT